MRYLIVVPIILIVIGCDTPEFTQPLSDYSATSQDTSMFGIWLYPGEKESALFPRDYGYDEYEYLHIGFDSDRKMIRILLVSHKTDGTLETNEAIAHTSTLDNSKYLNARILADEGLDDRYLIIKYTVKDDVLTYAEMEGDVLKEAVKKGIIKGEVVEKDYRVESIVISDTQNRIQKFIQKHDKELFDKTVTLQRIHNPLN